MIKKHDSGFGSLVYVTTSLQTLFCSDIGSFQVTINYLPNFTAVCASITSLTLHTITEAPLLEGSALLHCLTDGDTGRTSPNSVVSLNIRKHSGEVFSTAVRQHGFPYKWVQKVCGVSDQSDSPALDMLSSDNMAVDKEPQEFQWLNDPQMEQSAQYLDGIIKALKRRFRAQVNLLVQVTALGNGMHYGDETVLSCLSLDSCIT